MYSDFNDVYRVSAVIATKEGKFYTTFRLGKCTLINAIEFEEAISPYTNIIFDHRSPLNYLDTLKEKPINEFEIINNSLAETIQNINSLVENGIGKFNQIKFPDFAVSQCTELNNVYSEYLGTLLPKSNDHTYFKNSACKYYPCHPYLSDMNCLFCYCPLYYKESCPGSPSSITSKSGKTVKDCSGCLIPHLNSGWEKIIETLSE